MTEILITYFILVLIILIISLITNKTSKKLILIRKILSYFYGLKNEEGNEIIFQNGFFGCGHAVLEMMFLRLKTNNLSEELMNKSKEMLDMLFIQNFLKKNKIRSNGFRFDYSNQLNKYGDKPIILLMKNINEQFNLSVSSFFIFPLYLFIKIIKLFIYKKEFYHWVLLDKMTLEKIYLSDPFFGKISMNRGRFEKLWSKYALIIYTT
jgi:predicted double-glycine peptidase